jgi:putative Holliday junction resolvase
VPVTDRTDGTLVSPQAPTSAPQLILAFDYGTRRIGVASGDTLTRTARPLKTLERAAEVPWAPIDKLVQEFRPNRLIVGLPYNMDGTPTVLTQITRQFARDLRTRYGVETLLVDERLSSREAQSELREARAKGWKTRRLTHADVDMTAARILLERWLQNPAAAESLGRTADHDEPRKT